MLLYLHRPSFVSDDDTDADSTYQPPSDASDSDSDVGPDLPAGNKIF